MNTGIYAIENTVNGKMYVGSAANLRGRKSQHFSLLQTGMHTNGKLQNSYNKHGKEIFEFRTLLMCRKEDLLFYEQLAIDKFNAVKGGYNIAPIAGSPLGVKRTPEARANFGVASKARWADPEYRARNRAALRAGQASPEAKANYSAASKTRWDDPEYKARQAAAIKAGQASPEARAKREVAARTVWADPEYKARQSAASKTVWADPEFKAKMKIARADPEYRARQSATMKAYHAAKREAA